MNKIDSSNIVEGRGPISSTLIIKFYETYNINKNTCKWNNQKKNKCLRSIFYYAFLWSYNQSEKQYLTKFSHILFMLTDVVFIDNLKINFFLI